MRDMDTPLRVNEQGYLCVQVTAGESLEFFPHFSEGGRGIDLAGATFETALRYGQSADSDAVGDVDFVVANMNDTRRGLVEVSVPPDKTLLLPNRCYGEIRATLGDGEAHTIQIEIDVLPSLIAVRE